MKAIDGFTDLVAGAARDRAPFRLTHYAQDLAGLFHSFYTNCRVLGEEAELTKRLVWRWWMLHASTLRRRSACSVFLHQQPCSSYTEQFLQGSRSRSRIRCLLFHSPVSSFR